MAGIFDIGPLTETVVIRGVPLKLNPLPTKIVLELMLDFPIIKAMTIGMTEGERKSIDATKLVRSAPDAIPIVIAAALGEHGNKKAIGKAETLAVREQIKLVNAVLRLTFGDDPEDFKAELVAMTRSLGLGKGAETAASSRKPSGVSFTMDMPPRKRGPIPLAH